MRMQAFRAHHYLRTRAAVVEIPAEANAVLVAGKNGAGKTGLLHALRYILTGVLPRELGYKKDLPSLITDGEKDGWIGATFESEGGHTTEYKIGLKSGAVSNPPPYSAAAALSISPQSFMQLEPNARRAALFNLHGVSLKPADIVAQLVKDKHDPAHVEKIKTTLPAGFPATVKRTKELASEARGGWQATTGDTYGAQKAEGWKAPTPEVPSAGDLAALQVQFDEKNAALIAAQAKRDQMAQDEAQHARAEDARVKAANIEADEALLAAHDEKIDAARREHAEMKAAAAVGSGWTAPCPQCKTVLKSEGAGSLVVYDEKAATGPRAAAAAQVALLKVEELTAQRVKLAKAVDTARAAKLYLERLPLRPDKADLAKAQAEVSELNAQLVLIEDELGAAKQAASAASNASRITDKAAAYHADYKAYTALADAVEALPARFLTATLATVNEALDSVSKAFGEEVSLYDDMELRYGAFRYGQLSESQKWRAELALGLALAPQSSGIVLMDRFDMVQVQDRGAILQMLGAQTRAQVIIAATLKEEPKFPEGSGLFVHWIEG